MDSDWRQKLEDDSNFDQKVPYDIRKIESCLNMAVKDLKHLNPYYTLNAIYEFTKFFEKISSALSMGFSDITEKVEIMRKIFKANPDCLDIQSLLASEISKNIYNLNGDNNSSLGFKKEPYKNYISACRTFLRLLWFLEYVIYISERILQENGDGDFKGILSEAYDKVLSPRHTWLVRKAVGVAMTFSSARDVNFAVKTIFCEDSYTPQVKEKIQSIVDLMKQVWNEGHKINVKKKNAELQKNARSSRTNSSKKEIKNLKKNYTKVGLLSGNLANDLVKLGYSLESIMTLMKYHHFTTLDEALYLLEKNQITKKYNHIFVREMDKSPSNLMEPPKSICKICRGDKDEHVEDADKSYLSAYSRQGTKQNKSLFNSHISNVHNKNFSSNFNSNRRSNIKNNNNINNNNININNNNINLKKNHTMYEKKGLKFEDNYNSINLTPNKIRNHSDKQVYEEPEDIKDVKIYNNMDDHSNIINNINNNYYFYNSNNISFVRQNSLKKSNMPAKFKHKSITDCYANFFEDSSDENEEDINNIEPNIIFVNKNFTDSFEDSKSNGKSNGKQEDIKNSFNKEFAKSNKNKRISNILIYDNSNNNIMNSLTNSNIDENSKIKFLNDNSKTNDILDNLNIHINNSNNNKKNKNKIIDKKSFKSLRENDLHNNNIINNQFIDIKKFKRLKTTYSQDKNKYELNDNIKNRSEDIKDYLKDVSSEVTKENNLNDIKVYKNENVNSNVHSNANSNPSYNSNPNIYLSSIVKIKKIKKKNKKANKKNKTIKTFKTIKLKKYKSSSDINLNIKILDNNVKFQLNKGEDILKINFDNKIDDSNNLNIINNNSNNNNNNNDCVILNVDNNNNNNDFIYDMQTIQLKVPNTFRYTSNKILKNLECFSEEEIDFNENSIENVNENLSDKSIDSRNSDLHFGDVLIDKKTLELFDSPDVCPICFARKVNKKNIAQIKCKHYFCNECIRNFLTFKIRNGSVIDIKCLLGGCQHIYSKEEIKRNVTKEDFRKYKKFYLTQLKLKNPNKTYVNCPYPDCDELVDITNTGVHSNVECNLHHKFCKNCKKINGHKKNICNNPEVNIMLLNQLLEENNEDGNNVNAKYKLCPECRVVIEKVDECNKVKCTNCGYVFCWLCLSRYTSSHFKLYNVNGCPGMMYDNSKINNIRKNIFLKILWYLLSFIIGVILVVLIILFYAFFGCAYEFVKCGMKEKDSVSDDYGNDLYSFAFDIDINSMSQSSNDIRSNSSNNNVEKKMTRREIILMIILITLGIICQPFYILFYILYATIECNRRYRCFIYYS